MGRNYIGIDVFNAALERMVNIYGEGHRVIVSFSAGKDSGICLELAILAARETGRLPVEVVMRAEEEERAAGTPTTVSASPTTVP